MLGSSVYFMVILAKSFCLPGYINLFQLSCWLFTYWIRDGVSESQFNQVLNIELDQIIEVFPASIYPVTYVFNFDVILTP